MNYIPKSLDLRDVILDPTLDSLVEELAENVHETWAKGKGRMGYFKNENGGDAIHIKDVRGNLSSSQTGMS